MQTNFCCGHSAGHAENIMDAHFHPHLQKADEPLQGWVNRLHPYSNKSLLCMQQCVRRDPIFRIYQGSCGNLQRVSCPALQANKQQYECWAQAQGSEAHFHTMHAVLQIFLVNTSHSSITVIMTGFCPCLPVTVMTCIHVLQWSNCLGHARLS